MVLAQHTPEHRCRARMPGLVVGMEIHCSTTNPTMTAYGFTTTVSLFAHGSGDVSCSVIKICHFWFASLHVPTFAELMCRRRQCWPMMPKLGWMPCRVSGYSSCFRWRRAFIRLPLADKQFFTLVRFPRLTAQRRLIVMPK